MHYSVLPERLQPGHEHDLVGCEKVCEGHGYGKDTCDGMKGCHFDEHDQQCFSAVGQEDCDHAGQPEEHEHDLVGCEKVCEGHGYDKDTCDGMKGCHFDEHDQQCFSAVGQEDCDHVRNN